MSMAEAFASPASKIPPPFDHQARTTQFLLENPRAIVGSDCGTGKTRSVLDWFDQLKADGKAERMLVFAPKSILEVAWVDDAKKFTPGLTVSVARANNRAKAFAAEADVYVTNHDAVKWLLQNPDVLSKFDGQVLAIDESTAFKHHTSQRSKAMRKVASRFEHRVIMSGTLSPNSVLDIWHQALIVDDGERLGTSFWKFRQTVCEPVQVGPSAQHVKWQDKPGSAEAVADLLDDISVRYKLEECLDMPEHVVRTMHVTLPPKVKKAYDEMELHAIIELENGEISAFNAGAVAQKLLQILAGAVYDSKGEAIPVGTERAELIGDLVEERDASVVVFNWTHQRDLIAKELKKRKLDYAVIDGSVKDEDRTAAVKQFQDGKLRAMLIHPQSAGHGITLTRGVATIWASPTFNAEHWVQANGRVRRAGQTKRTEVIKIAASGTREEQVYERLEGKLEGMDALMTLLGA